MKVHDSIGAKMRRIILLTSGMVLVLSVATFLAYEIYAFRKTHLENISTLAEISAYNLTSSLGFERPEDAQAILDSLQAEPTIELAVVYDNSGEVFAKYPANISAGAIPPDPGADRAHYVQGLLIVVEPSIEKGIRKGTLYLRAGLGPLYQRLQLYGWLVMLVLGTSFAVTYFSSAWMQRRVTEPILALAGVASQVSQKRDFSVRASKQTEDEIGGLTEAFNEMLDQIAARDAALQQSTERLRLALEASRTGTWDWEIQSKRLTWDGHLHNLFGLAPSESPSTFEEFLTLVHPDDRDKLTGSVKQALEQQTDLSISFRAILKDGSVHYMASRGRAWVDDHGRPSRMAGVTLDITESKKAEQAIRESEERFRSMADAAPVMIWTADASKEYDYFNRSWLEFTGRTFREEEGMGWTESVHPEDLMQCLKTQNEAFESRRRFDIHYRLRRRDGEYRWIRSFGIPRMAPDGTFRGFIGSAIDVTEVRQAQIELERRVEARTAELAETNHELEAFTYSVSHDLRAPLRHINAYAQILEEEFGENLNSGAKGYVKRIRGGAKNMGMLVDDLLNLARLGRQELTLQPVALNSLVDEVLADLKEDIGERQIDWQIGDLGTANCDPGLLKQVFANLLSNAVKYSRRRTNAIIEVSASTANGESVYTVRDNGVGFNMKYAGKLFGVFQRLHRTEDFEGTGVGLATVERIIRKHGGRIWAEAELDKGATFHFTLSETGATKGNYAQRRS